MAIVFITCSFLFYLITLIYWLYLFFYRKKYTRERFAFSLLLHYSSIVTLFMQYVLAPNYFANAINYVLSEIFHWQEIQFEQPGIIEILAAIIILFAYFNFTINIHKNWSGGKSVEEIENSFGNRDTYLFQESLQFVTNHSSRILGQEERHESENAVQYECMEIENVVWHIQAAELLKLKDAQYKIDIAKNWYSQENCYIAKYGSNDQIVAILCSNKTIADAKISAFMKFVRAQTKEKDNIRYIWAIQDNVDIETKQVDGNTIEIVTEGKLIETLVDFDDYKHDIERRFAEKEIYEGYGLTLRDIYVEPKCTVYDVEKKKKENIESVEQYVADWLNDNSQHKQLALLGDYGQGKSVLSLRLAYQILTGKIKSERIPIIIELRGRYIKQYSDTREILYSWANRFNIPPKALLKLHYAGKLLLIFEGFDELDLIGGEEIRKEHFRKLWEYSIPQSKIIITGRPNYFMDDKEMMTLLRLSQQRADSSKYCETIRLEPFQREQIIAAMRSLKPSVQEEIINVYDREAKNSSFRDLVSRPSLLFLTGLIWEKEELASKLSNINSAEVIRAFLTYSYKRQDEKGSNAIMNSDERAYFMQGIAVAIVSRHGYTNQIGKKELEAIVGKLFHTFPDSITLQSGNANKKLLKNRLDENHLLQAINTDIRSCGILVRDFSTEDAFCFAHKSFLEVLIADFTADSYIMRKKTTNQDLRYEKLMTIFNTLKINLNNDIFLCDENIFKFVVEILTAKVVIKGEDNSKERVYSIYKQLHLYPLPLRALGWGIATLGYGFTVRTFRSFYILNLFVYPLLFLLLVGLNLKAFLIALGMIIFMIAYLITANWLLHGRKAKAQQSNTRKKSKKKSKSQFKKALLRLSYFLIDSTNINTTMRDLRVVAFYQVCRNLNAEQALQHIWPSYVIKIVEKLADRVIKNT